MKTIWFLPLEPLQQRYTEQMYRWVTAALDRLCLPYTSITGEAYASIKHGQWLDTSKTTLWKLSQLRSLSEAIANGTVSKGDLILLGDVWMPGIEAIKFQSDLLGLDLKIGGWHYAGCFDNFDYLARSLGSWGPKYEQALLEGVLDSVCFGSPFHRKFVERHCRLPSHVSVEGLAWDHHEVAAYASNAKPSNVVAFTHRWAPEKRPAEFLRMARSKSVFSAKPKFVISTNGEVSPEMEREAKWAKCEIVRHSSKAAYYKWLAGVKAIWSGADQETFGYSFMEAIALRKIVVAPNRTCYPDHFRRVGLEPEAWLYTDHDPCGVGRMTLGLLGDMGPPPVEVSLQYHNSHERYIRQFVEAHA